MDDWPNAVRMKDAYIRIWCALSIPVGASVSGFNSPGGTEKGFSVQLECSVLSLGV